LDLTSHSSQFTSLPNTSYNNNIITEPSIKDFLEQLDRKFGKDRYTVYLEQFELEEITILQLAEMNSEILLDKFGIEITGRRLNLIREAKKYL
jgi:hypothetical protein